MLSTLLSHFGFPDVVDIEIVYHFHKLDHGITCMVNYLHGYDV
jgi:hypothetical protein